MDKTPHPSTRSSVDAAPRVLALASRFLEALTPDERIDVEKRIQPALDVLSLGLFRLVVMGEIKKGKSSLINALLGQPELLPAATDIATSTVYKIMYGPESAYTVFFESDPEKPDEPGRMLAISREQLAEYGTEDGNPNNKKGVEFIGIELPHPLLREGLVIVDTPGVGGLFRKHRDITFRYAPQADAVFFVLDSVETVISADEIRFLKELRKTAPYLSFVQTKTDSASTAQWKGWRERNLDILSNELELPRDRIPYFCVSAKLKNYADADQNGQDLVESGFVHLLHYLQHGLLQGKSARLAARTGRLVLEEIAVVRSRLASQRTLASTSNAEALKAHEETLARVQHEAATWEGAEMQHRLQRMQDEIEDLRRHAVDQLQEAFDPNGSLVNRFLDSARAHLPNLDAIQQRGHEFLGDCAVASSELAKRVLETYRQHTVEVINTHLNATRVSFQDRLAASAPEVPAVMVAALPEVKGDLWTNLTSASLGVTQGAGVSFLAITVVSLVIPPIGAVAGMAAMLGGAFGAFKNWRAVNDRKLSEAQTRLERAVRETVGGAQRNAQRALSELATRIQRTSRDAAQDWVRKSQDELRARLKEAQETRRRTASENQTRLKELDTRLAVLDAAGRELSSMLSTPTR